MQIKEKAMRGLPLKGTLIIDMHAHMDKHFNFYISQPEIEHMIADMDCSGIDMCVVAPHLAMENDYKLGNKTMFDAVKRYPKRVLGWIVINPHYPNEMEAELDKYYGHKGVVGVKIHPGFHRMAADHKNYKLFWDMADERKMMVLTHSWEGSICGPEVFEKLAKEFRNVKIIMGHMGGFYYAVRNSIEAAKRTPNIYMDITGKEYSETWLDEVLQFNKGSDKLLFGTDMPFHNPAYLVGRVAFADIPEEDKKKIFGLNFKAMLDAANKPI